MRLLSLFVIALMFATVAAAQADTPWLGLKLEVVEAAEARGMGIDGGLKVTRVDDHSPAKEAGMEVGDVVLSAGQDAVTTIEKMREVLNAKRPGDVLSLGVRRSNGRNEPMLITLASAADKDGRFRDDAKVKELRDRLRDLDAERRRIREQLDERLDELGKGKADPETRPTPTPEPAPEEIKPETRDPERVQPEVTMGARFVNLTPEEAASYKVEGGVKVRSVEAGSAAEKADLKVGDMITKINGESLTGTGELRLILAKHKPGDKLELEVLREGGQKTHKRTLVLQAKGSN